MAEAIVILGVAGTVVGLASEGLRLCQTLDLYCEKVKNSEKEVQGIAHDIRDTAVVLEQLGANIKLEEELLICKPEFYRTAKQNVQECSAVFKEIEDTLCISANAIRNGKGEIITFEVRGRGRFKWPLKQGRMVLLRSDLVRLRSSLHLMATVMMHARGLQEKAVLDRESSIGVQIDALKIQTLELETEAAEHRYRTLRRKADQVKLHWTEQTMDGERRAEKVTLQDSGRSEPASDEFYVSDSPQDLKTHQNAGNPKIPLVDWKLNDGFDGGDNALLLSRNEQLATVNTDNLADEPSQGEKDDVLSTEWLRLENMLQPIATAQENQAYPPARSNTQGLHGVKVDGQDHHSGGQYLQSSKKPSSSSRSHQASGKRRGGSTSNSTSEPSSDNDGVCITASERDYQTEATGQSQATGGFLSKSIELEQDSIAIDHHEQEADYLDPYSLGLDLPLDENHPSSEDWELWGPETNKTLSNGSGGLQRNASDASFVESNNLATPIITANTQDPKLSEKDNVITETERSSDQEPDDEDLISASHETPTTRSLQRQPKAVDGEAGDYLAKVHKADRHKKKKKRKKKEEQKKIEDFEDFETGEHQPFPKSTSKDVSDGAETDEITNNPFQVSEDALHLPHALRNRDSKLTNPQAQAPESLKSDDAKINTASQDAERNGMNEAQARVTQAEVRRGRFRDMARRIKSIPSLIPTRVRLSSSNKANTKLKEDDVVPMRDSEEVGRAPSPTVPSTVQHQSPAKTPSPSHSVHSLKLTPNLIAHAPDEPKTLHHEPAAQDSRSASRFPAGMNAVSHQDWSICDLGNPSALSYPNGWVCKFRPDFLPNLTAWNLLRLSSDSSEPKSWYRVNRMMIHIDVEEIRHVVRNQRAKRKTLLDTFAKLSNYQQQQVNRLLEDLETLDYPKSVTWTFTLQALLIQPKGKGEKDTKSIQVFVERRLQPGTTPSHMVTELPNGYPLRYSTTQYPENVHSSSSVDPQREPPPAPPMSYMRPGHSLNSDPKTSTQPQHQIPSTSGWTDPSMNTTTQPQHNMPNTRGWTGVNTTTQPQNYMSSTSGWPGMNTTSQPQPHIPSTSSWTGMSTTTQPQYYMPSTSGWTDPSMSTTTQPQHHMSSTSGWTEPNMNTTHNANEVSAGSRTDKNKQPRKELRYRSGKENTVRFAPLPRTDHGHGSTPRESSPRTSSHSERRTPDSESHNIKGSSSLASIPDEYHDGSKSSTRREDYAQRSQKEDNKATPEKRQILPASSYQAPNLATLQHQDFALGQPPKIVESLLAKWTFLDMPPNGAVQILNHVATKTSAEDDAKTRAAIKKKIQRRRQTEPIPEMPEIEGMD